MTPKPARKSSEDARCAQAAAAVRGPSMSANASEPRAGGQDEEARDQAARAHVGHGQVEEGGPARLRVLVLGRHQRGGGQRHELPGEEERDRRRPPRRPVSTEPSSTLKATPTKALRAGGSSGRSSRCCRRRPRSRGSPAPRERSPTTRPPSSRGSAPRPRGWPGGRGRLGRPPRARRPTPPVTRRGRHGSAERSETAQPRSAARDERGRDGDQPGGGGEQQPDARISGVQGLPLAVLRSSARANASCRSPPSHAREGRPSSASRRRVHQPASSGGATQGRRPAADSAGRRRRRDVCGPSARASSAGARCSRSRRSPPGARPPAGGPRAASGGRRRGPPKRAWRVSLCRSCAAASLRGGRRTALAVQLFGVELGEPDQARDLAGRLRLGRGQLARRGRRRSRRAWRLARSASRSSRVGAPFIEEHLHARPGCCGKAARWADARCAAPGAGLRAGRARRRTRSPLPPGRP